MLDDEEYDKLVEMGIKALGIIYPDETNSPTIKCVTAITELTARLIRNREFLSKIYVAGYSISALELSEGTLLIEKFSINRGGEERVGLIFAEITGSESKDMARRVLKILREWIKRNGKFEAADVRNYLAELIH